MHSLVSCVLCLISDTTLIQLIRTQAEKEASSKTCAEVLHVSITLTYFATCYTLVHAGREGGKQQQKDWLNSAKGGRQGSGKGGESNLKVRVCVCACVFICCRQRSRERGLCGAIRRFYHHPHTSLVIVHIYLCATQAAQQAERPLWGSQASYQPSRQQLHNLINICVCLCTQATQPREKPPLVSQAFLQAQQAAATQALALTVQAWVLC